MTPEDDSKSDMLKKEEEIRQELRKLNDQGRSVEFKPKKEEEVREELKDLVPTNKDLPKDEEEVRNSLLELMQ